MITRPTLVISERICRANIRRMAGKAVSSGVIFRPHFKTHQSLEVAAWFRDHGLDKITVSSAEMAVKFADASWDDITIAFPANIREINIMNDLSGRISLNLLVDSPEVTQVLSNSLVHPCGIFIEIDCGYGRSGIPVHDPEKMNEVLKILKSCDQLSFKGFLLHSGDTYQACSHEEIAEIYHRNINQLKSLKNKYIKDFPEIIISIGDTPACSIVDDLSAADEIRPGNFVYYDLMQHSLGSCTISDIAVTVACPVAGIYPERNELLIYGGAVHLSKEFLEQDRKYYGLIVQYTADGWSEPIPGTRLISISQEHGIIKTSSQFLKGIQHGDILGILPVHSCLTANLLKENILVL